MNSLAHILYELIFSTSALDDGIVKTRVVQEMHASIEVSCINSLAMNVMYNSILTMESSSVDALRIAREEYEKVIDIINQGIQDYDTVERLVLTNRMRIPSSHRAIVKRLFRVQTIPAIETPDETHQWLKNLYNSVDQKTSTFQMPAINCENYDELFQFLINSKEELKRKIIFGYFLDSFVQLDEFEFICGKRHTTINVLMRDFFNISESYARKLRWLGRISYEHQEFLKLSLSLSQLVRKQKLINNMIKKRLDLASKWKISQ